MKTDKSLQELLDSGWTVNTIKGVMTIDNTPLDKNRIKEIRALTDDNATHIVFLQNFKTNEKCTYVITQEEDLQIAQKAAVDAKQIIKYSMRIECEIRGNDNDGNIMASNYLDNLKEVTGWRIEEAEQSTNFYVFYEWDGEDKEPGYTLQHELEDVLIALSIKNKVGFEIRTVSWGEIYKGHPFSVWYGKSETVPKPITTEDIQRVKEIRTDDKKDFLLDLVSYYSHALPEYKLISGFSVLEKLFDTKMEKLLSNQEIKALILKAKEIESLSNDETRIKAIHEALHLIPTKTRNQRMSDSIAALLSADSKEIYERVKKLSELRARPAHAPQSALKNRFSEEQSKIKGELLWIEDLILKLLNK